MTNYTFPYIDLRGKVVDQNGNFTQQYHDFFRSLKGCLSENFNSHGVHLPDINSNELSPEAVADEGVTYYSQDQDQLETVLSDGIHVITTTPKANPHVALPVVSSTSSVSSPQLGWVVFDESLDRPQVYKSGGWGDLV